MTVTTDRKALFDALAKGELTDYELLLLDVALQTDEEFAQDYLDHIARGAEAVEGGLSRTEFSELFREARAAALEEVLRRRSGE